MAVELEMTLKDAQVLMGLLKMAREQDNVTKAVKGTKEAFKDTAKEIDRTAEAAKKLIQSPIERMTEKERQLNAAFKAGKLTVDEKARAIEAYRARIIGVERETLRLAVANDQTFGSRPLAALTNYAAGVFGISNAISAVLNKAKEAVEFAHAQGTAGAESIKSDFQVYQGIAELSDTQAQFDTRVKAYEDLRSRYGLSRDVAAAMQETAISTGNEASLGRFAATQGVGDPALRMASAARLESLSKGKLNEVQADAALIAAAIPSQFKASEFAKFIPAAASMSESQGTAPTELLGTMSVMADRLKGADMAADRLQTLQTKLSADDRFKGKGILGAIDTLSGMSEEERKEFLSGDELKVAYATITQNRAEIEQRQRFIESQVATIGTEADVVLAKQSQFDNNPKAAGALASRVAEQSLEAAQRDVLGEGMLGAQTARAGLGARAIRRGDNLAERFGSDLGAAAGERVGGQEAVVAGAAVGKGVGQFNLSPFHLVELMREQLRALQSIDATNREMAAQGQRAGVPRGPSPAPARQ